MPAREWRPPEEWPADARAAVGYATLGMAFSRGASGLARMVDAVPALETAILDLHWRLAMYDPGPPGGPGAGWWEW